MPKLAVALARISGGTADDFMNFFGKCFVRYFSNIGYYATKKSTFITHIFSQVYYQIYSYDEMIKATGRYFCDFLQSVDNIHLRMRFTYPRMKSPSMYLRAIDENGAELVYRSTRQGFSNYFKGVFL